MSKLYKIGVYECPKTCKYQTEISDSEGFYEEFYCMKDWNICNCDCDKHRKLDTDWQPFIDKLERNLSSEIHSQKLS